MSYRATEQSSDLTISERADEGRKILFQMGLENQTHRMDKKEAEFVLGMIDRYDIWDETPQGVRLTVKELWWLRDLKDNYL